MYKFSDELIDGRLFLFPKKSRIIGVIGGKILSHECSIVEDLLPLYKAHGLQADTTEFIEQHLATCKSCQQLAATQLSTNQNLSMKSTLTFFHLVFIVLSFMFALNSSLLGNHKSFVILYGLFGCLTYLFYKNIWIVFAISSIPVFVWAIINNFSNPLYMKDFSFIDVGSLIVGASYIALLHTIFALLGAAFAIVLRRL